jgi:N-acyl-L-homoserine lactone synthetase
MKSVGVVLQVATAMMMMMMMTRRLYGCRAESLGAAVQVQVVVAVALVLSWTTKRRNRTRRSAVLAAVVTGLMAMTRMRRKKTTRS